MGDSVIGSDVVQALQDPIGHIFATVWPEEAKTESGQCFIKAHVSSCGRCVVGKEIVATERRIRD